MARVLAVDVGGTKLAAGVVDETGALLARARVATPRGPGADAEASLAWSASLSSFSASRGMRVVSSGSLTRVWKRGSLMGYPCSSGSSALRATATRVTPSGRFMSRTPIVCRWARRTSRALVLMTPPLDVIA